MRTFNSNGRTYEGSPLQNSQSEERLPVSLDKIRNRVVKIVESFSREKCLPIGLRDAISEQIAKIRSIAKQQNPSIAQLAKHVESVALQTYIYGGDVTQSETITQIRTFDLELEASRRNTGIGSIGKLILARPNYGNRLEKKETGFK